jgi:hypothetical protein
MFFKAKNKEESSNELMEEQESCRVDSDPDDVFFKRGHRGGGIS